MSIVDDAQQRRFAVDPVVERQAASRKRRDQRQIDELLVALAAGGSSSHPRTIPLSHRGENSLRQQGIERLRGDSARGPGLGQACRADRSRAPDAGEVATFPAVAISIQRTTLGIEHAPCGDRELKPLVRELLAPGRQRHGPGRGVVGRRGQGHQLVVARAELLVLSGRDQAIGVQPPRTARVERAVVSDNQDSCRLLLGELARLPEQADNPDQR